MTTPTISRDRIQFIAQREAQAFLQARPQSARLAEQTEQHYLFGVPLHWMADWGTPVPLFVERAQGAHFTDVDGHEYADFCLGDTGAMFGHSPSPVAQRLATAAFNGYTAMLPTADAAIAGKSLTERFGLPFWQLATRQLMPIVLWCAGRVPSPNVRKSWCSTVAITARLMMCLSI